jgi:hypothetical protein
MVKDRSTFIASPSSKYREDRKVSAVTSRQSFALSAVVVDVNDTDRLKEFAKRFGTILTVDQLEGRLAWHVSVTPLSDQFKRIPWDELKPSQREAVRQLAHELLDDVGRPDSDAEDVQEKSYQIIRKLTIEEERLVRKLDEPSL